VEAREAAPEEKREPIQPGLGIRIRCLRRDNGEMSQETLAELIDRSVDLVDKIERGKSFAGKKTLERLAAAFDISVKSLLDFEGNEAFLESGGDTWRAPRTKPKHAVRRGKVDVLIPKKKGEKRPKQGPTTER
jgi:transcriptional regulator with XRE-family HTH domain